MSNEATSRYSTWFSTPSAGYWERSRMAACWGRATEGSDWAELCDDGSEPWSSRTTGGWGDRAFLVPVVSLRAETEGERAGGKDEKEGWRWRLVMGGEAGPWARWAMTWAMRVSILSAPLPAHHAGSRSRRTSVAGQRADEGVWPVDGGADVSWAGHGRGKGGQKQVDEKQMGEKARLVWSCLILCRLVLSCGCGCMQ